MNAVCTWRARGGGRGMHAVHTWSARGMCVLYTLYTRGTHVVCMWYAHGAQLVCMRYDRDMHVVCTWYARGMHTVCAWSARGMHAVCMRCARTFNKSRRTSAQVRCSICASASVNLPFLVYQPKQGTKGPDPQRMSQLDRNDDVLGCCPGRRPKVTISPRARVGFEI